jgi:hypothetical protein
LIVIGFVNGNYKNYPESKLNLNVTGAPLTGIPQVTSSYWEYNKSENFYPESSTFDETCVRTIHAARFVTAPLLFKYPFRPITFIQNDLG